MNSQLMSVVPVGRQFVDRRIGRSPLPMEGADSLEQQGQGERLRGRAGVGQGQMVRAGREWVGEVGWESGCERGLGVRGGGV